MNIKDKILSILKYNFKNENLLLDALTHTSYLNNTQNNNFERLEFLGDRVLGLVISDILYRKFPDEKEGELARRMAVLVSGKTLAIIARKLNISDYIKVGDNLTFNDGENYSILSDTMEALIGAMFLDSNYYEVRSFIEEIWSELILNDINPPKDPKSRLQELAMASKYDIPIYSNYSRKGPDHSPTFKVSVSIKSLGEAYGEGDSKKEAERMAASLLLNKIESI